MAKRQQQIALEQGEKRMKHSGFSMAAVEAAIKMGKGHKGLIRSSEYFNPAKALSG
jgi:hypothetical protein